MYSDEELDLLQDALAQDIESMQAQLADAQKMNDEYTYWQAEVNKQKAFLQEIYQEDLVYSALYASLCTVYEKQKEEKRRMLGEDISNVLNSWYTGLNNNVSIVHHTSGKGNYTLVDNRLSADLSAITGDSSAQIAGFLVTDSVLDCTDSDFVFCDEAFSNTDAVTAKGIGSLINMLGEKQKQIIIVENKHELIDSLESLRYYLHYTEEEGTRVIRINDPFNEIPTESSLHKLVNNEPIVMSELQTYKEMEGD